MSAIKLDRCMNRDCVDGRVAYFDHAAASVGKKPFIKSNPCPKCTSVREEFDMLHADAAKWRASRDELKAAKRVVEATRRELDFAEAKRRLAECECYVGRRGSNCKHTRAFDVAREAYMNGELTPAALAVYDALRGSR